MNTSSFSDEELMAYADGELEAVRASQVHAACAADSRIAARVEMFRASRRLLTDAFEPALHEPVPDRLLEVIRNLDDGKLPGIEERARAERPKVRLSRRRPRFVPALAASIAALGAFTAGWLFHAAPSIPGSAAGVVAGVAPLADAVQVALERTATGNIMHGNIGGDAVDIVPLSTVSDGRTYCREFDVTPTGDRAPATMRGVACREGTQWVARIMAGQAGRPSSEDSYQTASGGSKLAGLLPQSTPVAADRESELIANGWKSR